MTISGVIIVGCYTYLRDNKHEESIKLEYYLTRTNVIEQ